MYTITSAILRDMSSNKAKIDGAGNGPTSASERISAAIKEDILSGSLQPGERIRLDVLADRFGTSRLPARDALRSLASEGLVEIEPYRGARVPHIDAESINQIYDLRMLLEPHALEKSAPHLTEQQLERMQTLCDLMEQANDPFEYLMLDKEFHLLSYQGAPSRTLRELCERFWNATESFRRVLVSRWAPQHNPSMHLEHRLILEALRRADGASSGHYLIAHYRRTQHWFNRNSDVFDRDV